MFKSNILQKVVLIILLVSYANSAKEKYTFKVFGDYLAAVSHTSSDAYDYLYEQVGYRLSIELAHLAWYLPNVRYEHKSFMQKSYSANINDITMFFGRRFGKFYVEIGHTTRDTVIRNGHFSNKEDPDADYHMLYVGVDFNPTKNFYTEFSYKAGFTLDSKPYLGNFEILLQYKFYKMFAAEFGYVRTSNEDFFGGDALSSAFIGLGISL